MTLNVETSARLDRIATSDDFAVASVIGGLGISRKTWFNWRRRQVAPRQLSNGRIARSELVLWLGQLDADRKASGKPHLRHPLRPLSWVADRSPFDAVAGVAREQAIELTVETQLGREMQRALGLTDEQVASILAKARRLRHGEAA